MYEAPLTAVERRCLASSRVMSRTDAIHETLQSNVSAIVQLTVSYPSFHAPEYAVPTESLVSRLWAYDAASNVVVIETGHTSALAPSMRRAAASAVCETSPRVLSNSGALAGFKMVRASKIQRVDVLQDDQSIPLTTVHPVPVAAIEARDAAAKKKCQERVAQLAPSNVSDVGQVVFDAVNKTYVLHNSPQSPLPLARLSHNCAG